MFNIVIADSNRKNAELIMNSLDDRDYNISISDTGINALSKVKILKPDILICLSILSDMSGFDLCKRIKSDPNMSECLILFIDPNQTNQTRIKALESGVDDFIDMSFDSFILKAKVKSLLRVKSLSDQLKDKYSELEEKNKLIDLQLEMGRNVQASLIKKITLHNPLVKITSKYLPAYIIGGDFYDVIEIDKDLILVVLGDVSGHGISAALLTTMLKIIIKNLSDYYTEPEILLEHLNNQFMDVFENSDAEIYTCALAAVIDTRLNTITYASAGLPPPLYSSFKDKTTVELEVSGIPIGMISGVTYESKQLNYNKNDLLLLHTDGLSDLFYKSDSENFSRSISKLLTSSLNNNDLDKIVNNLILEFCDENAKESKKLEMDDVSIILCRL